MRAPSCSETSHAVQDAARGTVLVVGAGITGLTSAVLLRRAGFAVEVWEARPRPGGMLEPVEFEGVSCDRGSHRVHPEAAGELRELTPDAEWRERPRRGRLLLSGRKVPYPPSLFSFLNGLGLAATVRMGLGFVTRRGALHALMHWEKTRTQGLDSHDEGFESFVTRRVGNEAYRAFYAPYAEKVWGIAPSELSRSVAKQRFSTARPTRVLIDAFLRRAKAGRVFLYPRKGMGVLIDLLVEELGQRGVPISFGRSYGRDERGDFDHVVFSGVLGDLAPETELGHRGLHLVHLAVDRVSEPVVDTFYSPERKFWFGRVSRLDRFSEDLSANGNPVLCIEVPEALHGSDFDLSGPHLGTLVSQLRTAGILSSGSTVHASKQTYVPNVYPMYTRGWTHRWSKAVAHATGYEKVCPVGRQGLFLHCNLDHCVTMARDLTDHIVAGGDAGSWRTETERYLDVRVRD